MEHLPNPDRAIGELAQVTSDTVHIMVPNNPYAREYPEHLYSWSVQSLGNLLSRQFGEVQARGAEEDHGLLQKRKGHMIYETVMTVLSTRK